LGIPSKFALNVHASLLPKYRGAAPVNWAIINGERVTGVTIFKMDAGLDSGEIAIQKSCQIEPEDDALSLEERLSQLAVELLQEVLERLDKNSLKFRPQEGEVSYAPKLKKEDGLLNWSWDAEQIRNRVRGLQPWPCAFTYLKGSLFKIYLARTIEAEKGSAGEIIFLNKESLVVKCGQDALNLLEVQLAGKRRMGIKEFLAGHSLKLGERLGT
jgi:methionyl-tRNA formyltransferase